MTMVKKFFLLILFAFLSLAAYAIEPVDINSATAQEIAAAVKGIGPKKAAAIVSYRETHGPFKTLDELERVPGIGPKMVNDNRDKLTVSSTPIEPTLSKPSAPSFGSPAGTEAPASGQ
jgi:competence protein ComEA